MKAIFNLKHTIKNKSNLRTFCTTNNKGDKPGIDKTPSVINNKLGYMHRFRERFSTKEEKEKRMKLLKSEMINNPEFFNAFPHLKNVVDTENLEEKYKMDQTEDKKTEYFESLL